MSVNFAGTLATTRKLAGAQTLEVDLEGAFVTPGFIDSHVHLIHGGLQVGGRTGRSVLEINPKCFCLAPPLVSSTLRRRMEALSIAIAGAWNLAAPTRALTARLYRP